MTKKVALFAALALIASLAGRAQAAFYTEDGNWNYQAFNPFAAANGLTTVGSNVTAPNVYAATSSNDGATYIAENGTPNGTGDFPVGTTFTSLGALRLDNLLLPNTPFPGTTQTGVTGTSGSTGVDALVIFAIQGVSGAIAAPGFQQQNFTKGAYVIIAVQGTTFAPGSLATWGSLGGASLPSNLLAAGVVGYGNLLAPTNVLAGNPSTGSNTGYTDTPSPGAQLGNTNQVTANGAGQETGSAVASLKMTGSGSTPNLLTNITTFPTGLANNPPTPGLFLDNIAETTNLGASLAAGQYTTANNIFNNIWSIAGLLGSPGFAPAGVGGTNFEESFNATFAVPTDTAIPEPASFVVWGVIAAAVGGWTICFRRKRVA